MNINQFINIGVVAVRNLIIGSNLISLSLIKKPRKMIEYATECLFSYKTIADKRGLPQKNIFDVLNANDVEDIKLAGLNSRETWFYDKPSYASDIVNLCLLCKIVKPKVIFEIGTLHGYTTYHFALNTDDITEIYTLDLPKNRPMVKLKTTVVDDYHIDLYNKYGEYLFSNNEVASKITCLFGDSAIFDFSPFYGKVDLFFIDGAHSYDYVRSDTLNALKCCRSGGVIAWHDFGRVGVNGVSKWLIELSKERQVYSAPGSSLAFMIVE